MKRILLMVVAAAMVMTAVPSQADTQDVTYVAGPFIRISSPSAPVGVGGYAFTLPASLQKIKIEDLNGPGVGYSVCQENGQMEGELPNNCGGEGDDVSVSGCSTAGAIDVRDQNFKKNSSITVFIFTATPACQTVGIGGNLRVIY